MCSGRGVMLLAVPGETASDPDFFAHVLDEQLPFGSVSPQRDERVGLKRPVFHLSARILDVQVEVRVRALPIELREVAGEVPAVLAVELRGEGVMGERRRRQQEQPQVTAAAPRTLANLHRNLHRASEDTGRVSSLYQTDMPGCAGNTGRASQRAARAQSAVPRGTADYTQWGSIALAGRGG